MTSIYRGYNKLHLNPVKYEEDESLIPEFKELLLNTCTFVDNWDSDAITPNTYRLYGKKLPARQECAKYVEQVKHQLHNNQYQEIMSEDIQNPQLSHQEWSTATELTRNSLDHQCKEPRNLLFFVGAVYQFTYNRDGDFSQSQLGFLLDLPSSDEIVTMWPSSS